MTETILQYLHSFGVFHANAFYAIAHFLKHNFLFLFVIAAIGYLMMLELKMHSTDFVQDERRMI